jgi:prepilin-type N-terminal cleavage/methylation domain-containing protein
MSRLRKSHRARRAGFTLVELMVTILLLTIGISGLVATSSSVSRMMGGSMQQVTAASVATSRFERLRGTACGSIASGNATTRGITEKWVATTINSRTFDVTDSITFVPMSRRAQITQVYRSYVRC